MLDPRKIIKPLRLAHLPTPLQKLEKISGLWGGDVWIKRDDLTGSGLSGNKVRKLECLLSEVLSEGSDTVISCGGLQSNHCRATALASTRMGLKCRLVLRGEQPDEIDGNLLLDRLAGAEVLFVSNEEYYSNLDGICNRMVTEIKKAGGKAYIVPEGGSNAVGAWGYVEALRELRKQCFDIRLKPDRIVCATGSGGTHAGLLAGTLIEGWDVDIVSISVCYDREETVSRILEIVNSMIDRFALDVRVHRGAVQVLDGYIGAGYAKADASVFQTISEMARTEGILVDPVYTGKAALAIKNELAKGNMQGTTIFCHTGGMFGLFPFRKSLADYV